MAKSTKEAKKAKAVVVIYPVMNGKNGNGKDVILAHNPLSGRYDLKVDGKLVMSTFHDTCVNYAETLGIKWE